MTLNNVRKIVKSANLIVGMHPDQAVDAIVDAALALNVSFFVIPCCVHSREFPRRRLKNGDPVNSYEELLEYLKEKDPEIRKEVLPFEGRNVCLYKVVLPSL